MDINAYIQDRAKQIGHNWALIAQELTEQGHPMNRDSVRNRFNRSKTGVTRESTPEKSEKERLLEQQRLSQIKHESQEDTRYEMLLDMLREAITPLEFHYTPTKAVENHPDEEVAVLLLSDLHFGKKTATYNLEVGVNRFHTVCQAAVKVVNLHRHAYPINRLVVLWCGDLIDGNEIYPGQSWNADQHVANQIFLTAPRLVDDLGYLASNFASVDHHVVKGNHGRISKFTHEFANFDLIFAKTLELATRTVPNMTWEIPFDQWYGLVEVMSKNILFYHGHQIKMHLNLPWYGITTRNSRWATASNVPEFDIACQGHFHTSSMISWNSKKILTNGTLVSADDWATEMIGLESTQSQTIFGLHRSGMTWRYELDFRKD